NPTSAISDETIANLNAQIVEDDMARVQVVFDEKKLGSSLEVSLDDSWRMI
ncbi:hypothetical protein Tco_0409502, partial [Tanacetum coccineum]